MNFYISDLHFGHVNILHLCNRPFNSIQEMNEALINNWNNRVTNTDDVYILGDVTWLNTNATAAILDRLKGRKHLIIGNHDGSVLKNQYLRSKFVSIDKLLKINDSAVAKDIVLCHYPIVEWEGYFRGVYHFYGHVHNTTTTLQYELMKQVPNAYNVGADVLDFTPRTFEEIVVLK